MKNGDGQAARLLLQEYCIGGTQDMHCTGSTTSKLETLGKFLTQMDEAIEELEDAGQPLYPP